MKKIMWMMVVAAIMVAANAQAKTCDYHQWRMDTCSAMVGGMKAQKCDYHQWRMAACDAITPVAPAKPVAKAPVEEKIVLEGILFDTNSTNIKAVSFSKLDKAVTVLKNKPGKSIVVVGHTDSQGADAYNQKLSEGRAKSVMSYFISKGIGAGRVRSMGKGETEPVADNATAEGRAQNRRIELSLR